jgi:polar amino acid transport system permease protein
MLTVAGIFKIHWSSYSSDLLTALLKTLEFTAVSFSGAALLGLVLALLRLSPLRLLRLPAAVYTEVFKNVPLLVIIFLVYFGLAGAGVIALGVFQAGALSLILFYAAYLSEIFRAAIAGVHGGQQEAAQALGLSRLTTFTHVVFPQALRIALPGTNTMLVDLLKSTSLLVTISAAELMSEGQLIQSQTFRATEVWVVIGAIYFALCYPLSQILLWLERKVRAGVPLLPRRRRRMKAIEALLQEGAPA